LIQRLPDPRRYGAGGPGPRFHELAGTALQFALHETLTAGDDGVIAAALRAAPTPAAYAQLWRGVCDAAHRVTAAHNAGVVARVFAMPLIIITGSRRAASLPGIVPDIGEIRTLFEQYGVLGPSRNFGIGNALCSFDALATVTAGEVFAWTAAAGGALRELAPEPIAITSPGEHVHLRFLVGAGIAPADAPSVSESASNIGAWGMALTRTLAAQLAVDGVEVLPLARPPLDLLPARHAGRVAQLDAALNLFVSNTVRRYRTITGDPDIVVSAHDNSEVHVTFSSPFDETLTQGFCWPLHPLDDIDRIAESVCGLLADCRLREPVFVPHVLPALNARGAPYYPTPRDEQTASVSRQH
jgi:hypothetical protein